MNIRHLTTPVLAALAALGFVASAHAQINSVQAGDWGSPSTWQGGVVPSAVAFNTAVINHAITVTSSQGVVGLQYEAGGSITGSGSGKLTLGIAGLNIKGFISTGAGVAAWETNNTFFDLTEVKDITSTADITWTHNGDLNIPIASWSVSSIDGPDVTATGSGLLTLNLVTLTDSNRTGDISALIVQRNLTVGEIKVDSGTKGSLNLISGTTQTNDLFTLGTANTEGTVTFSGTGAILRVLSSDLSVSAANTAIGSGFIIDGTGNGLNVSADGSYTVIRVVGGVTGDPEIVSVSRAGNTVTVEAANLAGGTTHYLLKDLDLAAGPDFTTVADSDTPGGSTATFTDNSATEDAAFYRVSDTAP